MRQTRSAVSTRFMPRPLDSVISLIGAHRFTARIEVIAADHLLHLTRAGMAIAGKRRPSGRIRRAAPENSISCKTRPLTMSGLGNSARKIRTIRLGQLRPGGRGVHKLRLDTSRDYGA